MIRVQDDRHVWSEEYERELTDILALQAEVAGLSDFPKSIACLTKAVAMSEGSLFRALLGWVYGLAGQRAKALAMLDQATTVSKHR